MNTYKVLNEQVFNSGAFSLVPIRFEDRIDIMKWRNEQIYHLRQTKPLTIKDQDYYFQNTINKIFDQNQPTQILFSFLDGDKCIGYGVLVHINWLDKNAEISFIMNTELESDYFEKYWLIFLQLIEKLAFKKLFFHKLFVYAFDLRPHLYKVLTSSNYFLDAILKEHCLFNEKFLDVVIHSKINN